MDLSFRLVFLLFFLSIISACVSTHRTEIDENDSGLEKFNKVSYNITDWVDQYFLKPVAKGYKNITPDLVESSVTRAFDNLGEIDTAVNSLLQGKFKQSTNDASRVVVNSTLGVLGLFEVAESMGLEKSQPEDFGQTLAAWGVYSGPFVYLPLLGPSTLRDAPSKVVDYYLDPITYVDDSRGQHILSAADLVQSRAALLQTEEIISGDRYLFLKDAYLQRRQYLIDDGELNQHDDFDTDF